MRTCHAEPRTWRPERSGLLVLMLLAGPFLGTLRAAPVVASAEVTRLKSLRDELVKMVPPLHPSDATAIKDEAISALNAAVAVVGQIDGAPVPLVAIRLALGIANLFYHRHHMPAHATAILDAVRAAYQAVPQPAFQAAAAGANLASTAISSLPQEYKPYEDVPEASEEARGG